MVKHFIYYVFVLMVIVSCGTCLSIGEGKQRHRRSEKIVEEYDDAKLGNSTASRIVNDPKEHSNNPQKPQPLQKADNVGSTLISSTTNILGGLFTIASKIIDAKAEATVEGIGIASRTAEDIANSKSAGKFINATLKAGGVAVEGARRLGDAIVAGGRVGVDVASRTVDAIGNSKTAGAVVDASVKAGTVAVDGAIRLGEIIVEGSKIAAQEGSKVAAAAGPTVVNVGIATVNGLEDLTRLKICIFLCPLQGNEEKKEKCKKDNCEKKDRSDGIDYYDGDFRGFDY